MLLFLLSFSANYYQFQENYRLRDNDIKYRYVKLNRGIEYEDLYEIEDIFEFNPDEKQQKAFRKDVRDYERRIEEIADELERANFKEVKAQELLDEAEKIKNK